MRGCKLNQSTKQFLTNLLALTEQNFNLDELRSLCFHLGINYDRLRGETIDVKASELILYHGRRVQLPDLLTRLKAERPNVSWPELPADFHLPTNDEPPTRIPPLQLPPRATHFTGRQEELFKLLDSLHPGRIVTLVGPGGIGKTALAAEAIDKLITDNKPPIDFPGGVAFYSFYGRPSVVQAAAEIVRQFSEDPNPDPLLAAARVLGRHTFLLVLDGAEEAEDDRLSDLLNLRSNCGVLITSRDRNDIYDIEINVSPLPIENSITLLKAWGKQWASDETAARTICELVGNLALAVRLVGAYLHQRNEFAAEYLEWLRTSPLQALDFGERRDKSIPILLEKSVAQVSSEAQSALAIHGCLALAPIDISPIATALALNERRARDVLGELVNYSLLSRSSDFYELTHSLLHKYANENLNISSEQAIRLGVYYTEIAQQRSSEGIAGYQVLDSIRSHLLSVLVSLDRLEQWDTLIQLVLAISGQGGYLEIQGHWIERKTILETGVKAVRLNDDEENESIFLTHLGITELHLGNPNEAIGYFLSAKQISHELGDLKNEAIDLVNLATAYTPLQRIDEAIDCLDQALTISRLLNIKDPNLECSCLLDLGIAYAEKQNWRMALHYYRQARRIARKRGYPRIMGNILSSLGIAHFSQGDLEGATKYYLEAIDIAKLLGDRAGEAFRLANLSQTYAAQGKIKNAIDCLEQAVSIFEDIHSPYLEQALQELAQLQISNSSF